MKKFFSSLIILIIIGAALYMGYTVYFGGQNSMNMQVNSGNSQANIQKVNYALMNKESVDKIISTIDDALKTMSLDPYSPGSSNNQPAPQGQKDNTQANNGSSGQGNTIINIYPSGVQSNNSTAPNPGVTYDPAKMEQFHTGIYKISVGMQILSQLRDEFAAQAEQAAIDIKDPIQYYTNQYNLTLQNKNKLNQVLLYMNDAANFVNINPYVSPNGVVFDKDKMQQVHGSVYKLAQGTVALNKLSDDVTKQMIALYNLAQNNSQMTQSIMPSTHQSVPGLFGSINTQSLINILLIIFITVFIIGILGLLFSLLKPKASQVNRDNVN